MCQVNYRWIAATSFESYNGGEFVIIWWWAQHRGVATTHRSAIHASKHVWRTTTSTKQQLRSI